jgi:hypothetical protein
MRPAVTPPIDVHPTDSTHGLHGTIEPNDHLAQLASPLRIEITQVDVFTSLEK